MWACLCADEPTGPCYAGQAPASGGLVLLPSSSRHSTGQLVLTILLPLPTLSAQHQLHTLPTHPPPARARRCHLSTLFPRDIRRVEGEGEAQDQEELAAEYQRQAEQVGPPGGAGGGLDVGGGWAQKWVLLA